MCGSLSGAGAASWGCRAPSDSLQEARCLEASPVPSQEALGGRAAAAWTGAPVIPAVPRRSLCPQDPTGRRRDSEKDPGSHVTLSFTGRAQGAQGQEAPHGHGHPPASSPIPDLAGFSPCTPLATAMRSSCPESRLALAAWPCQRPISGPGCPGALSADPFSLPSPRLAGPACHLHRPGEGLPRPVPDLLLCLQVGALPDLTAVGGAARPGWARKGHPEGQ